MYKEKVFDELLVLKCQEGDKKAFELLFKRWNKKLISFAYKYLHDVSLAKDVVQESWIAVFKNVRKLEHPAKFSSWVFRLTYNKTIDHLRKTKKEAERETSIDQNEDQNEDQNTADDQWPEVNLALNKLPSDQKVILTLFYLESKSVKQIAEIFNAPEGTIKSRIFYAREKLKKNIRR